MNGRALLSAWSNKKLIERINRVNVNIAVFGYREFILTTRDSTG